MKNVILASLLIIACCAGCGNERETASGQKFTVLQKGDGKEVANRQIMIMSFLFKDSKDSVWHDSRKNPYPQIMQKQGKAAKNDKLMEVIYMLTKGDSVSFKMTAVDVFTNTFRRPLPAKIDSSAVFTFVVRMTDVLDSVQFEKYRADLIAKQNEKELKQRQDQLGKDTVLIDDFLKANNIKAMKTASGIRYVVVKEGKGPNVADGQTASVNYAGYLLNGKYFDTSIEQVAREKNIYRQGAGYKPYDVPVGRHAVIAGWEEALKLMNKGAKMTVYIPSTLAYGNQKRSAEIIENSILAFDLEVTDIKIQK